MGTGWGFFSTTESAPPQHYHALFPIIISHSAGCHGGFAGAARLSVDTDRIPPIREHWSISFNRIRQGSLQKDVLSPHTLQSSAEVLEDRFRGWSGRERAQKGAHNQCPEGCARLTIQPIRALGWRSPATAMQTLILRAGSAAARFGDI